MNELKTEWIGEKSWTYETTFDVPSVPIGAKAVLNVEGLDIFATLIVNDKVLLQSENMFLTHRVDITEHISSAESFLEIDFDSDLIRGRELEELHPEYRFICHHRVTGSLDVRKAQYHWVRGYCLPLETVTNLIQRWDWCPVLMTADPWGPVRLEIFEPRVSDLWAQIDVSRDLSLASGKLLARVNGHSSKVVFRIRLRGEILSQLETTVVTDCLAEVSISLKNPELWYPHGYVAQILYHITVDVFNGEFQLDTMSKRTRLRRGELIQNDDEAGQIFYIRINGNDIFCVVSCWIPADNFIPPLQRSIESGWKQ
jgi:beta-mannosidase